MATQALYRRYRPRRFGELKGQDHVVRALRDAVRSGREGQAYLFSGPRGTGKTTSARILAKVLNCERPVDGEPCCECESCLAVERGTSYDVHELDAASNNGVDAIRDLIEKASLGTPGRHRVYILDEVHMLSKAAEAALLKTLEEPPPHVVFVLATTDPQKMSDTIRSRTQHLQFHLLPADTLAEHVRWVAADAGIDLGEAALDAAVSQGGGSARDTLSALELIAATGGDLSDLLDLDEFVRAMIDRDAGRVLTAAAHAVSLGHEPRTLTEALVRHLRDGFLSLMAPELVQLPQQRVDQIAESAQELGAAALVRAIERLGTALVDMRHSPDPRIALEVALVQLTHDAAAPGADIGPLVERVERLERALASGRTSSQAATSPSPVDPATGRAVVGGRARRSTPSSDAAAPPTPTGPARETPAPQTSASQPTATTSAGATSASQPSSPPTAAPQSSPPREPAEATTPSPSTPSGLTVSDVWESTVRPGLKPLVRAIYSAGTFTRNVGDQWYFAAPNAAHGEKCEAHRASVEAALSAATGTSVRIVIEGVGTTAGHDGPAGSGSPASAVAKDPTATDHDGQAPSPAPESDDDIDLAELTDAPPESVLSPIDRLAQAFPGAELIDDD